MYEEVQTGPLYERVVQAMTKYRRLSVRMHGAKSANQGALERKLEKLNEEIDERLGELSDQERMALSFWRDGILQDIYELDVEALMARPYTSIKRIDKSCDEYDIDERRALLREIEQRDAKPDLEAGKKLREFLDVLGKDRY